MKITIISLDNWGYNQYLVDELNTIKNIEASHINFDKLRYKYPTILHKITNAFTKTLFNYNLKRNHLNNTILNRLKELGYQDKILIIKSDFLSIKTIKTIKQNTSQLIAFYNDNTKRCPRIKKVHPYFDTNYSFEKEDVKKFNFNFITNFIYHKHLDLKPDSNSELEFEVFNISSLGKRNRTIENVAIALDKINKKYKIILVGNNTYSATSSIEYRKTKLDIEAVNKYISRSKALLDVHRKWQTGLTFRVMDSLAFNKKLITTNPDIVNYDFYNVNNILLIDPENVSIPNDFLNNEYKPIPENIYKKYTINCWVKTVFQLH